MAMTKTYLIFDVVAASSAASVGSPSDDSISAVQAANGQRPTMDMQTANACQCGFVMGAPLLTSDPVRGAEVKTGRDRARFVGLATRVPNCARTSATLTSLVVSRPTTSRWKPAVYTHLIKDPD